MKAFKEEISKELEDQKIQNDAHISYYMDPSQITALPLNKLRPPAYVGNGAYPYHAYPNFHAGYPFAHQHGYPGYYGAYPGYGNEGQPYRYAYSKSPTRLRGDPLLDQSYQKILDQSEYVKKNGYQTKNTAKPYVPKKKGKVLKEE